MEKLINFISHHPKLTLAFFSIVTLVCLALVLTGCRGMIC